MMTEYEILVEPENRCGIELKALECGHDLSVTICGGNRHHIGAVALGCPKPKDDGLPGHAATVSVICALGHRDDEIARKAARYLATELERNVSVAAGVHVDEADAEDLKALVENCDEACRRLVSSLRD
jgi:hypothetical protein